eukprot:9179578-Pyramimonas_sp.AAC.1
MRVHEMQIHVRGSRCEQPLSRLQTDAAPKTLRQIATLKGAARTACRTIQLVTTEPKTYLDHWSTPFRALGRHGGIDQRTEGRIENLLGGPAWSQNNSNTPPLKLARGSF